MADKQTDSVLTLREVAVELRVSEKTVRRLVARGTLLSFRIGRAWRVRRSVIDAYIDYQERLVKGNVAPSPPPAQNGFKWAKDRHGKLHYTNISDLEGWDYFH